MMKNEYDKNFSLFYSKYLTGQAKKYARFIEKYISDKIDEKNIIDFMCGTGDLLEIFNSLGWKAVGVDLSEEMLGIARQKNLGIEYLNQNILDFHSQENYNLAVSTADALNHIRNVSDLEKVFLNIFKSLKPEGYFIFDMNTVKGIRNDNGYVMTSDDSMFVVREGFVDEVNQIGFTRFTGFLSPNLDSNYVRFDSTIYNYMFEMREVIGLLKKIGFSYIELRDGYSDRMINENDAESVDRVLFIVKKSSLYESVKKIRISKVKRH
ncbi:class I SAM-dependent DNA methyltransferase [Streptococcus suis]